MRKRTLFFKLICAFALLLVLTAAAVSFKDTTRAQAKTIRVTQAKKLSLAVDTKYKKIKNEIILAKLKYDSAVKSIAAKKKNLSTFRWSPLLSFKFPKDPSFSEEIEFTIKPITITASITEKKHELANRKYAVWENVGNLYTKIYTEQETIAFKQQLLKAAQDEYDRNLARKQAGENVLQSDLETMESSIETLKDTIIQQEKNFQNDKEALGRLIGMDITTNYTFKNPYESADIERQNLKDIQAYAVSQDHTIFVNKVTAATNLVNLKTVERLLRNEYRRWMGTIDSYITTAKSGGTVDYTAFTLSMKTFLNQIDSPWEGKRRILFFKIRKEFFKGDEDGQRYIEDDPYLIVSTCQEYENSNKDYLTSVTELEQNIKDTYENLMNALSSYKNGVKNVEKAKTALDKILVLNKAGTATYSEVKDKQKDYQDSQQEMLDNLSEYTKLLNSFDALTCGAVTMLLSGQDISTSAGGGGDSFADVDPLNDPYYYIQLVAEDMAFEIGVSIPEDFLPEIGSFEVYIENTLVGQRTEVGNTVRHLALDYRDSGEITLFFYDSNNHYVCQCKIDPDILKAKLDIPRQQDDPNELIPIAEFSLKKHDATGMTEFVLEPKEEYPVAYYRLLNSEGLPLFNQELIKADQGFQYLSFMASDITSVMIELYDSNKEIQYTANLAASYEVAVKRSELKKN